MESPAPINQAVEFSKKSDSQAEFPNSPEAAGSPILQLLGKSPAGQVTRRPRGESMPDCLLPTRDGWCPGGDGPGHGRLCAESITQQPDLGPGARPTTQAFRSSPRSQDPEEDPIGSLSRKYGSTTSPGISVVSALPPQGLSPRAQLTGRSCSSTEQRAPPPPSPTWRPRNENLLAGLLRDRHLSSSLCLGP